MPVTREHSRSSIHGPPPQQDLHLTGDDGTTGLGDGSRLPKTHGRIEAYGTVDEANSAIGVVLAVPGLPSAVSEALMKIQHELFDLGGELSVPGYRAILDRHIDELEQCLDRFNEPLPMLKEFILPGGGPAAAACHVARAITRRAERCTWALAQSDAVAPEVTRDCTACPICCSWSRAYSRDTETGSRGRCYADRGGRVRLQGGGFVV